MIWRVTSVVIGTVTVVSMAILFFWSPLPKAPVRGHQKELDDTALMYVLKRDRPLLMDVLPKDRLYYCVSRVMAAPVSASVPEPDYGLRVEFISPKGRVITAHDFAEHTKWDCDPDNPDQKWAEPAKGDDLLTETRVTAVRVDEIMPEGGRLKIENRGPWDTILLKVYKVLERPGIQREIKTRTVTKHQARALSIKLGMDLNALRPEQQAGIFRYRWLRMSLRTVQNTTPPATRIYFKKHPPTDRPLPGDGTELEGNRVMALNFGVNPAVPAPKKITIHADNLSGIKVNVQPEDIRTKISPPVRAKDGISVVLPPGKSTVFIANNSNKTVKVRTIPPVIKGVLIRPDTVKMGLSMTGQDKHVEYLTTGFGKYDALRLRVWIRMDSPADRKTRKITLKLFRNNVSRPLIWEKEILPQISRLDWFELRGADTRRFLVSMPVDLYVWPRARKIDISTNAPMMLQAYSRNPDPYPPDSQPVLKKRTHWRYKSFEPSGWIRMWPDREQTGPVARIIGQTRLEPTDQPETTDWSTCASLPVPKTRTCFESIQRADLLAKKKIPANIWCRCKAKQTALLALPTDPLHRGAGVLSMIFRVPISRQDNRIELMQGKRSILKYRPPATRGVLRVAGIRPRTTRIRPIGTDFAMLKTLGGLKGPVCGTCQPFQAFMATKIRARGQAVFSVRTSAADRGVNVIAYASGNGICLRFNINNGRPEHKRGINSEYTPSRTQACTTPVTPAKSVWLPGYPNAGVKRMNPVFVPLRADMDAHIHKITVRNTDSRPVWVRMFKAGECGQTRENIRMLDIPFTETLQYNEE